MTHDADHAKFVRAIASLADCAGEVDGLREQILNRDDNKKLRLAVDLIHNVATSYDKALGLGIYSTDEPEEVKND